jgi:hypothetical protein
MDEMEAFQVNHLFGDFLEIQNWHDVRRRYPGAPVELDVDKQARNLSIWWTGAPPAPTMRDMLENMESEHDIYKRNASAPEP